MKGEIIISVVIPTYNRADFISSLLDRFLMIATPYTEIIIVDDGSTDSTPDILNSYSHPSLKVIRIANSERGAARNYGAKKASGKFVSFFDSDDMPKVNYFTEILNFIDANKNIDLFYFDLEYVDLSGKVLKTTSVDIDVALKNLFEVNFIGSCAFVIRRKLFLDNLFCEDRILASSEDWELNLRIFTKYRFKHLKAVLFSVTQHLNRSLNTVNPDFIYLRDSLLLKLVGANEYFTHTYPGRFNEFVSKRFTFFALNYALNKNRTRAFRFLWSSFFKDPFIVITKRFWAVIKHILK